MKLKELFYFKDREIELSLEMCVTLSVMLLALVYRFISYASRHPISRAFGKAKGR